MNVIVNHELMMCSALRRERRKGYNPQRSEKLGQRRTGAPSQSFIPSCTPFIVMILHRRNRRKKRRTNTSDDDDNVYTSDADVDANGTEDEQHDGALTASGEEDGEEESHDESDGEEQLGRGARAKAKVSRDSFPSFAEPDTNIYLGKAAAEGEEDEEAANHPESYFAFELCV